MSTIPFPYQPTPGEPEPVWGLATLYPGQGAWTEEEYLRLTDGTNRLIEFTDGRLEFLAMPTEAHQLILAFLFDAVREFVRTNNAGLVLFMGLRVRVRAEKIREPDIVFIAKENYDRRGNRFWTGADLVMEVVSPDDASHTRDHEQKVGDYAEAGISEYWIVDPQLERIKVLELKDGGYAVTGEYEIGQIATSVRLAGFSVDVKAAFDAAKQ